MLKVVSDGEDSLALDQESVVVCSCGKDGLFNVHSKRIGDEYNLRAVFGGDSVFVSKFHDGIPSGVSILISLREKLSSSYLDGMRSKEDGEKPLEDLEVLYELFPAQKKEDVVHNCVEACLSVKGTVGWDAIIPERLKFRFLSSLERVLIGNSRCFVGSLQGERVLLYPLPSNPPSGSTKMGPGLQVKECDIWVRRLERLFSIDRFPSFVLQPIGFTEHDDKWFFVTRFPGYVSLEDIDDLTSLDVESEDFALDLACPIAESVAFIHSEGLTFNGFLNRRAFIFSSDHEVWLNTAYVFTSAFDKLHIYGQLMSGELRYLAPTIICRLSAALECISSMAGSSAERFTSAKEEDFFSLGSLFLSFKSLERIPFEAMGLHEYILKSIAHGDASFLLADLVFESETSFRSFSRIANPLIGGKVQLHQVIEWIKYNFQVRDRAHSSSIGTEMKGMIDFMTTALKSGPTFMKLH